MTDFDQHPAARIIADLRQRVQVLEAENKAVSVSRDTYRIKVTEMEKQLNYWKRRAEKVPA